MRELKPAQAEAAYTLDRHISVTAGPGAGKTTVLVERYLHILRTQDITVDQIVAITFTNRAANEMRERLRQELDRLLRRAAPDERRTWMRHKRTLDGAVITTIHGFCSRLLREFPAEAGIDPQFALLDQHQSAMLEESVVEQTLTEFIDSGDATITRLTAGVGRARLAEGLIGIFRGMRNQGLKLEQVKGVTADTHATIDDYKASLEELNLRMSELIATRGLSKGAEARRIEASIKWPQLRALLWGMTARMLANELEWSSLAEYCQAIEEFRKTKPRAAGIAEELVKDLDRLIWKDKLGGLVPRLWFDLYAREYAGELMTVLARIELRMQEEKLRLSALDFDDLQLRVLKLLDERPEVLRRASRRYRFYLVDEFQDTNTLQRDLMLRLALDPGNRANLFIVGDRKQSIYGFRGADVDVFREMTEALEAEGGESKPLNLNFRSQPPLIDFFNLLFKHIFTPADIAEESELKELGFVEHEASESEREGVDKGPLVELLIDLRPDDSSQKTGAAPETPRERDAWQVATRISRLVRGDEGDRRFKFRNIALLFRAMSEAWIYEAALRQAGIPFLTVQGKGFYEREEVRDLIQLLRFLDNMTDELALAAVLRSPLCGISDDELLSIRCGPVAGGIERGSLHRRGGIRNLFAALEQPQGIVPPGSLPALWRARNWLTKLVERRNRSGLAELLRFAVETSEFRSVISATFDGAQRLANVEKLFTLAERFERSGTHMIRDFVRFIRDFEAAGGRESEGQMDDSADAVRLMTIHQSKGLEFPVVILPELHRLAEVRSEWYLLDRHRGLTVKVPDGRGWRVIGHTLAELRERAKLRDHFENMRLLYVAATRAEDRLILSGAAKDLKPGRGNWLGWIAQSIGLDESCKSGEVIIGEKCAVRVALNMRDEPAVVRPLEPTPNEEPPPEVIRLPEPAVEAFPLLGTIESERQRAVHRFSVTQLINYRRCPRQYYFDRVLHAPTGEESAVWNDAEAPEPPANLNATLRGAVIHRFCEKYVDGDPLECLRSSLDDVLRLREAELGDRVAELDRERAVQDLEPLARNYLSSNVRERIESARRAGEGREGLGVLSEQRFRLRRPLGILTGTIDKLLVWEDGNGLSVEIIDFKTNRFRFKTFTDQKPFVRKRKGEGQLSFGFLAPEPDEDHLVQAEVNAAAADYELQMQSYALAAHELISKADRIQVTLHFLDPNLEKRLPRSLLERDACASAIDETMLAIVSSNSPESFEVRPADHCRVCSFQDLCGAGRKWLAEK